LTLIGNRFIAEGETVVFFFAPASFIWKLSLVAVGTTNLSVCGKHQMVAKIFNLFPDFFLFCFKVKICHLVVWTFVRLQLSFSDNVQLVLTVEASFNKMSAVILI
jgi:hypothetical protein